MSLMLRLIGFPPVAMEETLCRHPDVAEAAVFGVRDDLKESCP